jgi:pimeloyl-ACP methyl ester carboxylesterase
VIVRRERIELHGHVCSYRTGGRGPVLVLLHGITNSSASWEPVFALLAQHFTVVAPDLLGHGDSAKPRGDYSLGANASLLRDLLLALGHERATIAGHSLGGGIAMQFSYQFPERVERLVLVSSGGLGRQVTPVLRAVALPGAELVLPLLASQPLVGAGTTIGGFIDKLGVRLGADIMAMATGFASLRDIETRRAFVHTARSVIDFGGQRVNATDKLYLAQGVPTLIAWGDRDPIIPARHGIRAHELMPGQPPRALRGRGPLPAPRRPGRLRDGAHGLRRDDAARGARRGPPAPARRRARPRRLVHAAGGEPVGDVLRNVAPELRASRQPQDLVGVVAELVAAVGEVRREGGGHDDRRDADVAHEAFGGLEELPRALGPERGHGLVAVLVDAQELRDLVVDAPRIDDVDGAADDLEDRRRGLV